MVNFPKDKKIILFDGVCNLCDSAVQFMIKHDKADQFRFVSLQSPLGNEILKYMGVADHNLDSIIFYEPGKAYYYKSAAVMQIAKGLGGIFSFSSVFSILSASFTDCIYDYVAKNRYKWYGKKATCLIPGEEVKDKFLSQ